MHYKCQKSLKTAKICNNNLVHFVQPPIPLWLIHFFEIINIHIQDFVIYPQVNIRKMAKIINFSSNYAVCWSLRTNSMIFCWALRTSSTSFCWALRNSSTSFCWAVNTNINGCVGLYSPCFLPPHHFFLSFFVIDFFQSGGASWWRSTTLNLGKQNGKTKKY